MAMEQELDDDNDKQLLPSIKSGPQEHEDMVLDVNEVSPLRGITPHSKKHNTTHWHLDARDTTTTSPSKGASPTLTKNTTTTPRKRKQAPSSGSSAGPGASTPTKTPTKRTKKNTDDADDADAAGTHTRATLPPIPTSLSTAGDADKMILRLRDENKPWSEINKLFSAATGIKVGQSTLRMRYTTMKANFVGMAKDDESRLLRLKKEIEDKFDTEKWHRIVEAIVADGGAKYPAAALQKKFKELSKGQNAVSTSAAAADDDEE
ncbi:uncharacterized protein BDV17DRAFT_292721 [Aspergillus undulatus]|uniref:uncharacterized protein n=1 Tax=Aspergillus undulatus TaxID=1810928 RepID=UPI003CCE49EB